MVQVRKQSMLSGKLNTMELDVPLDKLLAWQSGEIPGMIQDIFPELSTDEREFLLSGATSAEWDATFGEDEEE